MIKKSITITTLSTIVVVGAIWAVVAFTNFNAYKTDIEQAFFKKTYHKLKINGELLIAPIPFKITIKDVTIYNKKGFSSNILGKIQSVELSLSLWQLLINNKIDIDALEIAQAKLYLETNLQGKNNWAILNQASYLSSTKQTGFIKVSLPIPAETKNNTDIDWNLRSFVAQNSHISWHDSKTDRSWQISNLSTTAFDLQPNTPFYFISKFSIKSSQNPAKYHTKISGQLKTDRTFKNWRLQDWRGTLLAQLPRQQKIPELRLETNGNLLEIDFHKKTLTLTNAQLNSVRGNISTNFKVNFSEEYSSSGNLTSSQIDLKKWFRHTGIKLPTFVKNTVLSNASLALKWTLDDKSLVLQKIKLQWDESLLQGKIIASNLNPNQRPNVNFDIHINKLNLDLYKAKRISPNIVIETALKSKLNQTYLPLALPISTLKAINLEGNLTIDKFKAWNISFQQLKTTLFSQKGQLNFAPLDAKLYGGEIKSKLSLDVTGKTPSYNWAGKLNNIELEEFLQHGWQYSKLSGKYNGQFGLNTKGVNGYLLKKNLSGSFSATVDKGHYKSQSLLNSLLKKQSLTSDSTSFSKLELAGKIKNGVFKVKKLNLTTAKYSAIGTGSYNLLKNQIDTKLFTDYQDTSGKKTLHMQGNPNKSFWRLED